MNVEALFSAANAFALLGWLALLLAPLRRSPAMTRPPLQVSATIVVPCGASTTPAAPVARPPGSRPGSTAATKSVKEELPAAR